LKYPTSEVYRIIYNFIKLFLIERVWGTLEQHWKSSKLDSKKVVLKCTENLTWKGKRPSVKITKKYILQELQSKNQK